MMHLLVLETRSSEGEESALLLADESGFLAWRVGFFGPELLYEIVH